MIKFFIPFLIFVLINSFAIAQKDSTNAYQKAQNFMRKGDFQNAELVLNNALQQTPNNIDLLRMLTTTYYLQRNYNKALEIGVKIAERPDADVMCYQALGLVYKAIADYKSCEKLYNKALQRNPNSGLIYAEYGELFKEKDIKKAIQLWEKGIQVDPNHSTNYFNTCIYYAMNNQWIWAILYGETFINLESLSARTKQVKSMLLDGYKQIFIDINKGNAASLIGQDTSRFIKAVLLTLSKQATIASNGITPESLVSIRSKFITDWYAQGYAQQYPFFLFSYMKMLIQKGFFEAYNQWAFGIVANEVNYQVWQTAHQKENADFIKYQRSDVLKLPKGQYYK